MPSAWAMNGFQNILIRGLGLESVWMAVGALSAYAVGFFLLAVWRFRKMERNSDPEIPLKQISVHKIFQNIPTLNRSTRNAADLVVCELTEFMAEKMRLRPGVGLLDIGIEHGYQTCFLAKEYDLFVIAIDPGDDRVDGVPHVEHLQRNLIDWELADQVIGLKTGVPDTRFAGNTFDFVHSTTTLEMVRGLFGVDFYQDCLTEIYRILRPGGIFGLGEPMHLDVSIPPDLVPIYTRGGGVGPEGWADCFATVAETVDLCREAGFSYSRSGLCARCLGVVDTIRSQRSSL